MILIMMEVMNIVFIIEVVIHVRDMIAMVIQEMDIVIGSKL